jgi:hypothetical protein
MKFRWNLKEVRRELIKAPLYSSAMFAGSVGAIRELMLHSAHEKDEKF